MFAKIGSKMDQSESCNGHEMSDTRYSVATRVDSYRQIVAAAIVDAQGCEYVGMVSNRRDIHFLLQQYANSGYGSRFASHFR